MLPLVLKTRAKKRAKAMGISFGELVRESLSSCLRKNGGAVKDDVYYADRAVFRGRTPVDLSVRHDDYLYGGKE